MDTAELLKKLDAERDAYLATLQQVHEALANAVVSSSAAVLRPTVTTTTPPVLTLSPSPRPNRVALLSEGDSRSSGSGASPLKSTFVSGEGDGEDASDEDEALYVQDLLPTTSFDDEHLRNHLKSYKWDAYSRQILRSLFTGTGRLKLPNLFPADHDLNEAGSHYSLYQVFDVGNDGTPLSLHTGTSAFEDMSKDQVLWHLIKDINVENTRQRRAIGRIIILREPSPVAFGIIHLVMNEIFDMDKIFQLLVQQDTTMAYMKRAFHEDPRKQKSFVFSFEYFTIIGEECSPMSWQQTDRARKRHDGHIPITRCSSVVALALIGEPIRKVKNSARRAKTQYGYIYSPWAPWHVLNIQCYPDWKSHTGSHDSTKHYVNGPEAFLNTLLVEYKDAHKRIDEICQRISTLVTPPADFMFNGDLRDKLLFEDKDFTYSRRYFWAFQTLGTMNHSIKAMIDAYESTFTDTVWEGRHHTLWPLNDEDTPRNAYWKKRLASLRTDYECEIGRLKALVKDNEVLRKEIRELRDNLFSGTSVLESRKSVEQTEITVQQGQNIKLLTLVNLFFLPLTFVTSVFGMTNMPTEERFWRFGIVMATVCVPFFLLIGSMNTSRGMYFWRNDVRQMVVRIWFWIARRKQPAPGPKSRGDDGTSSDWDSDGPPKRIENRSMTAAEGIRERTSQYTRKRNHPVLDTMPIPRKTASLRQKTPSIQSSGGADARVGSRNVDNEMGDTVPIELSSPLQPPLQATATNTLKFGMSESRGELTEGTKSEPDQSKGLKIWRKFRQNRRETRREYPV
ncbi:Magnesium transport protein CorA, transmembrane region [Venustampulla echinocandica]|uniref:Magnesium transport protein CorA, transmembrane region n=1 Tax=Venustampulla echinocandica TaxID=2656787 RepID=A0A370TQF3_9HELO|nr:Magnesium transport protein CorA, transmembrane region [Venustampulla echinocandica]RDL37757.1 Magnesium transport protein CorA, transmembrane region [Venustampulla echinocandica]